MKNKTQIVPGDSYLNLPVFIQSFFIRHKKSSNINHVKGYPLTCVGTENRPLYPTAPSGFVDN